MKSTHAVQRAASGVTLAMLMTASAAEESPAAVACPCADAYVAARAEYNKHPGPSLCQSAHDRLDNNWNEMSITAEKKKLTGSKWRRVYLSIAAIERCTFGIRCARCSASVHAEKRVALVQHQLFGKSQSGLSDAELEACQVLAYDLISDCSRPGE